MKIRTKLNDKNTNLQRLVAGCVFKLKKDKTFNYLIEWKHY